MNTPRNEHRPGQGAAHEHVKDHAESTCDASAPQAADHLPAAFIVAARSLLALEARESQRYAFLSLDRRAPDAHALAVHAADDRALDRLGHSLVVAAERELLAVFGFAAVPIRLGPGERVAILLRRDERFIGPVRLTWLLGGEGVR